MRDGQLDSGRSAREPIPGSKAANELLRPKSVKVEKTDSLLAIIHGVGRLGWRNREARQIIVTKRSRDEHSDRSAGELRK